MTDRCAECDAEAPAHYGTCSKVPPEMATVFAEIDREAVLRRQAAALRAASIPDRSSGELWTEEEEERLRILWLALVEQMPGRSEPAVAARVDRIRTHNRGWPQQPLSRLSRGPRI